MRGPLKASVSIFVAMFALLCTAFAQTRATVNIRLNDPLSSGSSQPGDSFTGTLDGPLVVGDRVIADAGTRAIGQISEAVSSGRLKTPAKLTLRLKAVEARRRIPMQTGDLTIKASSHSTRNLLIIGGSAAVGSLFGASAGGGKGAAIGATAGAGAGVVGAYLSGKREIVLPAETLLTFHVTSVVITPAELAKLQRSSGATHNLQPERVTYFGRRHGHDDDDDEDDEDNHDGEHEHEGEHHQVHVHRGGHEYEYESEHEGEDRCPRTIDLVFYPSHRAVIVIGWPQRVERLTLGGDDLDDILQPLSTHTRVSIEVLRPRIHVKRDDD